MDSVTHTLIGVGMANALFRKRVGPESVPILVVASNLPDVDALARLMGDPTAILIRRTFGHSVFMLPIWAIGLAVILRRLYPHQRLSTLFGLTLLGAAVHVFFDLVNSFGVVLLWPLSDWRPELAIIFIIDLFLTGFLATPLLLCLIPKIRPHLVWLSRASVACVVTYVLFCGFQRVHAQNALTAALASGSPPDFTYVFPEPLGPHRWRGVVLEGQIYQVYLIHALSGQAELKMVIRTDQGHPAVEQVRNMALARRLEWFFRAPVWTVMNPSQVDRNPQEESAEVTVHDLRFRPLVIQRGRSFEYRFRTESDGRVIELGWSR